MSEVRGLWNVSRWDSPAGRVAEGWMKRRVDRVPETGFDAAILADGDFPDALDARLIHAMVVVEDWTGVSGLVTAAVDPGARWCRELSAFFDCAIRVRPFEYLKYERLTSFVSADNLASVRFTERMGATREATLKGAGASSTGSGGTVDLHVYAMRQGDYARKRYS